MNSINIKPNSNLNLYGYQNFFLKFIELYKNEKLPNKILFSGQKGIGKSTLAYHITNYIFSQNEENKYNLNLFEISNQNKSFKLIQNNTHPNFHLIDILDEKKSIEISQIREMLNYANKSSFNNQEKIILIDNIEKLNLNSLNALLKIVEEPNDNIIFFLIFDNSKNISDTLKSRCIKFNLFLNSNECIDIANKILKDDIRNLISKELINYYVTPGDFLNLINFSKENNVDISKINLKEFLLMVIDNKYYKKNIFLKKYIFNFIDFYFVNLIKSKKFSSSNYKKIINKIFKMQKYNLDEETFFMELKYGILNE